jgi:histidine triad (HIT) family protein
MAEDETDGKCVFCSIASKTAASHVVGENENALAVLEINPVSRGHTMVIPKKHISFGNEVPDEISGLSQEISRKISKILSPKDIIAAKASLFGHDAINIVPVYSMEDINSERYHASKEELDEIREALAEKETIKKKADREKTNALGANKPEKVDSKTSWLPKRIP